MQGGRQGNHVVNVVAADSGGGAEAQAEASDALQQQLRAAESTKDSPFKSGQLSLELPSPLKADFATDADVEAGIGSGGGSGSTALPKTYAPPKRISLCWEVTSVLLALLSVLMTLLTYMSLGKAATAVDPVLRNWQEQPLLLLHFVQPGAVCPEGSEAGPNTSMEWPGIAGLGCACAAGGPEASSFGGGCTQQQLAAGCAADEGVPAMQLDSWRGTKICLERGGQAVFSENWDGSVVTRPNPATEIPHQCPDGYRRCGRTSMDDWRATCTLAEDECPVTLLASQAAFPYYGDADQLSVLFAANQASRADLPFLQQTAAQEALSLAESSLVVSRQLPLVEFTTAFMHPGSDYPFLGPCNQNVPVHDNIQATYTAQATYASASPADINFQRPGTCEATGSVLDSRWKPYDTQTESAVFQDNFLSSAECTGLPGGDLNAAFSTNYFSSGTRCTTYSGAPVAMQCESGVTGEEVCAANDPVCESKFYQSRCGRLINVLQASLDAEASNAAPKIGLFARNEIYWKEQCDSSYNEVKSNDAPLQRAVLALQALLGINGFMNLVTIAISLLVIFIWEFDIDLPCIDGGMKQDAAFLKLLTEKISGLCKVVKVVPCVVALIYLSYVLDFYEELADVGCSDATTNMNFNDVGATLPPSFQFCLITLLMDAIHFLMPYMRKWWRRCRGLDTGTQLAAVVVPQTPLPVSMMGE